MHSNRGRTLSCSHIFLFLAPSICPLTTAGASPTAPPPSTVYKDTGASRSITANVVKGLSSGDPAAKHLRDYSVFSRGGLFFGAGNGAKDTKANSKGQLEEPEDQCKTWTVK